MPRAVLITSHFWNSKRKAGFHNIADSLMKMGYEVLFLTGNASYIHHLKSDYRASLINDSVLNKLIRESDKLNLFIRFTPLHPVNYRNRILNSLLLPSIRNYGEALSGFDELSDYIKLSDIFIFESFPGLLWFDHFKRLNKNARFVYRISDDMRQLKKHPYVIKHEENISRQFDLISVPSRYIFERFSKYERTKLHHHGIRKDLFDAEVQSPFADTSESNFVFTGNAYLDRTFLTHASEIPDETMYHILGPFNRMNLPDKIKFYGEVEFRKTIPYVKFADAGLHTIEYTPGAEAFSDSLKVIQYTYCKLPILAPEFLRSARSNFVYYKPDDHESIRKAIVESKEFDRSLIDTSQIDSWDDLTRKLIAD